MNQIERVLRSCRELAGFCTRNGSIDNDTLHYRVLYQSDREILAMVQFEEIIMEAPGRLADRVHCGGRIRLWLDHYGEVARVELV